MAHLFGRLMMAGEDDNGNVFGIMFRAADNDGNESLANDGDGNDFEIVD
jgi:hypothetical protein